MYIYIVRNNVGDMIQIFDIIIMICDIIEIIEIQLVINIVEDIIFYEWFVIYFCFVIQYIKVGEFIYELDVEMIDIIKEKFKDVFLCVLSIGIFVKKEYGFEFFEKELCYIVMYIQWFYQWLVVC